MKILYQWGTAAPGGWEEVDSSAWASLPARSDPTSGNLPDGAPGWINRICVQGVEFTADHYAVEDLPGGVCRVYAWSDSAPRDGRPGYVPGTRYARVWTFQPLAPDAALGGAINTRQSQAIYADVLSVFVVPGNASIHPWDDFVPPDAAITRHGVWIPDALYQLHESVRAVRGWREWTEGLAAREIGSDGRVRPQRALGRYIPARGTRTYYANNVDQASTVHIVTLEKHYGRRPAGASSVVSTTLGGGASALVLLVSTPPGEPLAQKWPTGDYRVQLDVTAAGIDITFGLLTAGTADGHFARVNSGLTSDLETKAQTQAAFAGSGLHLATTGSVSWTAGSSADRFEALVAATRAANHGNQSLTFELGETDDFADGPWVGYDAVLFGTNM